MSDLEIILELISQVMINKYSAEVRETHNIFQYKINTVEGCTSYLVMTEIYAVLDAAGFFPRYCCTCEDPRTYPCILVASDKLIEIYVHRTVVKDQYFEIYSVDINYID